MGQTVATVASVADTAAPSRRPLDRDVSASAVRNADPTPMAADHRLVIEEAAGGGYVYKTLDRRTGEVIQQLPREDVVRMAGEEDYVAGDVFAGDV